VNDARNIRWSQLSQRNGLMNRIARIVFSTNPLRPYVTFDNSEDGKLSAA
jgi:hypothetical protein